MKHYPLSKLTACASLLLMLFATNALNAATKTWAGTGATGAWITGTNWSGGTAPVAGDDVIIGGSVTTLNNVPTLSLNSLTVNGTSTLSLTASAGATLTIGTLTVSNGLTTGLAVNLVITNGTITSGKQLTIGSNRTLTVNGTLTANGSSNTPLLSSGTTTINSGGLINYVGGSIVAAGNTTVSAGAEVRFSGSGTVTGLGGSSTIYGTVTLGGTVTTGNAFLPDWATGSLLQYTGTSQQTANYYEFGTTQPTNVTINNASGVKFNTSIPPSPVIEGTLKLQAGVLTLTNTTSYPHLTFQNGDNPIVKVNGSIDFGPTAYIIFGTSGNTGGAAFTLPDNLFTNSTTLYNMTVNRTNPLTLNNQNYNVTTFVLTAGLVNLGTGSITVARVSGTPTVSNMFVASSASGYLKHTFLAAVADTFTYPLGEITGATEYSPAKLAMNSTVIDRTVGFKVLDAIHPQMNNPTTPADYITRYWPNNISTGTGAYDYTLDLYYQSGSSDVVGTETSIAPVAYNAAWVSYPGAINSGSHYLDIVNATDVTAPLGYDFTGRTGVAVLPPANDDCANATDLIVNSTCVAISGTTVSGTNSGVAASCGTGNDVWYTFTAPSNGSVRLAVTGTAGFNPVLNLRSNAACPNTNGSLLCYDYNGANSTEAINVTDLVAGQQYKVRVAGSTATAGTFNICANSTYVPAGNDNIANALIAIVGNTTGNNNSNYGIQLTEPYGSNWLTTNATNSQWFVFTPSTTGCYKIGTSGFDTQLAIYTATTSTNFATYTEVASDDNGGISGASIIQSANLTAGITYYIQVNGTPYTTGTPTLTITDLSPTAPVATAATNNSCTSFTANWGASAYAGGYQLDISSDNFNTFVIGYNNLDVANVTTYNVSGLTVGTTYQYRVRAYGSCNASTITANSNTITVTTISATTAPTFTHGTTTLCAGQTDTYTASGSNIRYGILSGGASIDSITGVVSNVTGNFTVRATSTTTCGTSHTDLAVTITALPLAYAVTGGGNSCSGPGISVGLANSQNGVSYQLKNGGTNVGSPVAGTGSAISFGTFNIGGTYTVEASVTGSGCINNMNGSAVITVGTAPAATITAQGATSFCQGDSVLLSATTGNGNTYQWLRGGAAISNATNASYTALIAGIYSVSVTNGGCTATSNTIAVTINTVPSASITASTSIIFCAGDSVTLSTTTVPGYTYQWFLGGVAITNAISSSYTATTAGDYYVEVNNGTCATSSNIISTTVNAAPTVSISAVGTTTFCDGGSVTLSASAGGNITYQWLINNVAINNATGINYIATIGGNYTVRVNNGQCTAKSNIIAVTVNSLPSTVITANGPLSFCPGGTVLLTAPVGVTYLWSTSESTQSIPVGTSGNFTVTVTNSNGCSVVAGPVTVTVSSNPTASITASGNTTFCQGDSVLLTASAGTAYLWSTGATTSSITVHSSGSYSVTVTLGSNCTATSGTTPVFVNVPPTVAIVAAGSTTICQGNSVVLFASQGTGYNYQWSLNNAPINGAIYVADTATQAGNYKVTVTDANGCTAASSALTVDVNPLPAVAFTAHIDSICTSGIPIALSGGSPVGGGYSGRGVALDILTPTQLTAGPDTLYYTYTTVNGCSNTAYDIVQVNVCTGIDEVSTINLSVFPNPTDGNITITGNGLNGNAIIEIHDMLGVTVLTKTISGNNATFSETLDMSTLAGGVYVLSIKDATNQTYSKKIIRN